MKATKLGALASSALLSVLLVGCGGSDSGGVTSAPTPPAAPPAGANANLLGPLKSESFVNDAAQGSLSVSGNGVSTSSGPATATFIYNATNQTYTMTAGDKSQSFGPGNLDPADSSSAANAYLISTGTSTNGTTDSLTLTNPGTSGRFTYQYVGAAVWQHTVITSSTTGNGTIYALAYGEPTPTAAVPTSGTGQYSIDIIGAFASNSTLAGLTGQGNLLIDFATDKVLLAGTLSPGGNSAPDPVDGIGTLASSGGITGSFDYTGTVGGKMTGRLYGPDAQEVGGSFYTGAGDSDVTVGAFIGRNDASTITANTSFSSISSAQFFAVDTARQYSSGTGTNALGTLELGYVPTGGADQIGGLFAKDYTTEFALGAFADVSNGSNIATLLTQGNGTLVGVSFISPSGSYGDLTPYDTQYVRAGVNSSQGSTGNFNDYFIFGFDTPASSVPTTGTADYDVNLDGTLETKVSTNLGEISGVGTIDVDFATDQVTTSGTMYNGHYSTATTNFTTLGSFSGTGTLAASSDAFTSNLSVASATAYTGNLQGKLFGPSADEVGAVFTANGTDGSSIGGVITGTYTAPPPPPPPPPTVSPLSALTGTTNFTALEANYASVDGAQTSQPTGLTQIAYDASTQTYTITANDSGYNPGALTPPNATLNPSNVDPTNSNGTFTAYASTSTTARIFNPGSNNPVIQLSYVSFADVVQTGLNAASGMTYPVEHFEVFGNSTATMPTTGTATYSGVVYGTGYAPTLSAGDVSLGGTAQLSTDFGAGSLSATLNLTATPISGGATQAVGSFGFTGTISGSAFTAYASSASNNVANSSVPNGNFNGGFFGPIANEVGGAFTLSTTDLNTGSKTGTFAGVVVGKKN